MMTQIEMVAKKYSEDELVGKLSERCSNLLQTALSESASKKGHMILMRKILSYFMRKWRNFLFAYTFWIVQE